MTARFILIFILISACTFSPGFKKEPSSKNPKKIGLKQNGVTLSFHNINKMNPSVLPRIADIQKKSEEDLKDPRFLYYGVLSDSGNIESHHRTGLVGDVAASDFEDLSGFRAYLCGPAPMVAHTQSLLLEKGIDPKRIHAENWLKG